MCHEGGDKQKFHLQTGLWQWGRKAGKGKYLDPMHKPPDTTMMLRKLVGSEKNITGKTDMAQLISSLKEGRTGGKEIVALCIFHWEKK